MFSLTLRLTENKCSLTGEVFEKIGGAYVDLRETILDTKLDEFQNLSVFIKQILKIRGMLAL